MADNQLAAKQAKLQALQDKFRKKLPQRMAQIRDHWRAFESDGGQNNSAANLLQAIHSLAGSAGTFGYQRLGLLARQFELLLREESAKAGEQPFKQMLSQYDELIECATRGPEEPATRGPVVKPRRTESEAPLIYVLEDDPTLGEEIRRQLLNFGFHSQIFSEESALAEALKNKVPGALVIDVHLEQYLFEGPSFAAKLFKHGLTAPPIIFISSDSSWKARLAAVRAGGTAYLTKPLDFSSLVDVIDRNTGRGDQTPYRILVVDDDSLLGEHYATVLQASGMIAESLDEPSRLLDVITTFKPELIVMDLHMPHCSGVDAAQVIRQNPAHINIPIVYLSTETGLSQQLEAMSVGGDDFLHKPISDQHLIAAIEFRVERFRSLRNLMGLDSLTGLLNHIALKLTLESDLEHARRSGGNLCFVMVDIDHFKSVNDKYGHPVGDRVIKGLARLLKQRLRKSDVVGRYGGEEFALILRDADVEQAHHLIDELRQFFAEISHVYLNDSFSSTLSAGIASAPPHADIESLINAADKALYAAKHAGRNCVVVDEKSKKHQEDR